MLRAYYVDVSPHRTQRAHSYVPFVSYVVKDHGDDLRHDNRQDDVGQMQIIHLREYDRTLLERNQLTDQQGEDLWRRYGDRVQVEFPSPKTGGEWGLTPQGWVGTIPLPPDLRLQLQPKIPLGNLFRMLEYAYRLESFHLLEGLVDSTSLEDLFERLASILSRRVLDRSRRGFYRAYVAEEERLPYLRGSLDLEERMRQPWRPDFHCHYQEQTPDIEDNQILAWTLYTVARSGICSERTLKSVRGAYRSLASVVSLQRCDPSLCNGRSYSRLNDDYAPLHALCRFFLEGCGPGHDSGEREMIPFLVNMGRLFELFVAEWLSRNLPEGFRISAQERVAIDSSMKHHINIDLVVYEISSGTPRLLLDTKYKTGSSPSNRDIEQVVSYAVATGCQEAVLLYPAPLDEPLDTHYGESDIRLHTLAFRIDGDLERGGRELLQALGLGRG